MAIRMVERLRALTRQLPDGLADAASLWFVLRLGLGLVALVWIGTERVPGPCHFELALDGWTTFPPLDDKGWAFSLVGVWQRWDACWYTKIAAHGYEPGTSATAFFPFLPLVMRALGPFTGGDYALAGMVANAVAFVVAMTGLFQLVRDDFGPTVARRTVRYLAIFPAAFFLFAPFTEAIFLASAVWAILAARRRQWPFAILAAIVAGLTRTQGALLAIPLAWEAWLALRDRRAAATRDPGSASMLGGWQLAGSLVAMVAPVLAGGLFAAWSAVHVGQSPFAAQSLWGGTDLHWPWETIQAAWSWTVAKTDAVEGLNLAALLGFGALFLAGLGRVPATYSLYVLPQLALLAVRIQPTPLTSTTRYTLVLFPCFVMLALLGRHRRFHDAWTVMSLLGLGLLAGLFVRGDFVA